MVVSERERETDREVELDMRDFFLWNSGIRIESKR